jgi:single-strand DNA-binding protein
MYHKLILVGNVGRDPEMRYTPSGTAVVSFSVAVSEGFGDKKSTIWFRVSAWDKLAEACNQYLKKGSRVLVEGRLIADPETGGPKMFERNDKTVGTSFEVTASTVKFLSGAKDEQEEEDDEVPF